MLLCRYSGLAGNPRSRAAFRLTDDLLVTDHRVVGSMGSKLDGLPSSPGPVACPADFGDAVVAVFGYGPGADDLVRLDLHGCNPVSNGRLTRTARFAAGQALLAQIEAMTSHTGIGISRKVRTVLSNDALRDARDAGDRHPFDIEAVKTTYLKAEKLIGPDRANDLPAWEPVYVFAERGRFTAYLAPIPFGASPPAGTAQGAILTTHLRVTDGFLSHHYPALTKAGKPVSLR